MNYKLGPGLPEGYRCSDATKIQVAYMTAMTVLAEQAQIMIDHSTQPQNIQAFTELKEFADNGWLEALGGTITWRDLQFPFGENTQPVKETK
jgi:predicted alpha-1,6-mannanase (GH76 family)